MDDNYQPAWKVAMSLGNSENFQDLKFRRRCLFFVLNNGPSEFLEDIMKHVNLLEIQILNKSIQDWMPPENEILEQEAESDEEFADAVTTVREPLILSNFIV